MIWDVFSAGESNLSDLYNTQNSRIKTLSSQEIVCLKISKKKNNRLQEG